MSTFGDEDFFIELHFGVLPVALKIGRGLPGRGCVGLWLLGNDIGVGMLSRRCVGRWDWGRLKIMCLGFCGRGLLFILDFLKTKSLILLLFAKPNVLDAVEPHISRRIGNVPQPRAPGTIRQRCPTAPCN